MQFGEAVEEFLQFCAVERQLSQHTIKAYESDLVDLGKCLPGGALVSEISSAALKEYLEQMVVERKLTPATVRRRFACLRAFFRRLSHLGEAQDPFANWRPMLQRRRRLPRALSRSEVSCLLSAHAIEATHGLNGHPDFLTVLRLMVSTGVRVGELCKMRIEDVSADGSSIRVLGKGSRDRVAYVGDTGLRRELLQLIKARRRASHAFGSLLVNRHGAPLRPQSIRSKLRRHGVEAGLTRRVTPHMLRHTAATLLIESGVDIRFVQRLLGHSSIATTEIYTHVSDEALRTTLERADVLGMLAQR
jgi:integrase/recombinase XerD